MNEGPQVEALLRAVPFFTGLDRVDLARLAGILEQVRYREREIIFWVVGFVVLVAANAWLHPTQSDYCRVARDSAGNLFEARHALIAGVALTLLTFAGLAVAVPYWRARGILTP